MSFEPGGDPRIPNQMPLPDQRSEARPGTQRRPEDLGRALVPVAITNGAFLVAAILAVYVFELVDPELGIWLIVALAALTSIRMMATIRRFQRSAATTSGTLHPGTEHGSVDRDGHPSASSRNPASPAGPATHAAGGQGLRFEVEDVFSITGRGTVVTGAVAAGTVTAGQPVLITRGGETLRQATVSSVELFRKMVDVAAVGDKAGLLMPEVTRSEVAGGDVIVDAAAPGQGTWHG